MPDRPEDQKSKNSKNQGPPDDDARNQRPRDDFDLFLNALRHYVVRQALTFDLRKRAATDLGEDRLRVLSPRQGSRVFSDLFNPEAPLEICHERPDVTIMNVADRIRKNHRFVVSGGFLGGSPATQRESVMIGKNSFSIFTTPSLS